MPKNYFLLDIETAGLMAAHHPVTCIGTLYFDSQDHTVTSQLLLQSPDEEATLLENFIHFCKDYDKVYTYNGKSFDWPFLIGRAKHYNLDVSPLEKLIVVDLKKLLSRLGKSRTALEDLLHFKRQTTSSGKELVKLYKAYALSQNDLYKKLLLAHNQDELLSLLHLTEVYHLLYHLKSLPCLGILEEDYLLQVELDPCKELLTTAILSLTDQITLKWEKGNSSVKLMIKLLPLTLKRYVEPTKDYYIILSTGALMHKSLATFISKEDRRKAKKSECVLYSEGLFVKLSTTYRIQNLIWFDALETPYLKYEDAHTLLPILWGQLFYLIFQEKGA